MESPYHRIISPTANIIMDNEGNLQVSWHDKEHYAAECAIIKAIIERKGWYRSRNGKDSGQGKYLPGDVILGILKENPEWIRTKVSATKFGL